ncbi:MAG: hypothetical protein BRD27_04855 [Bacteroidetes bacterium QH_10_64_19]|jgi:uncharacterized protein (DUF433 family)|nr:MAG: hypothetical protein BRD27_04855 [Bacteroidetes bacterium QH_10_64_19]
MSQDVQEARNVVQVEDICGGVPTLEGTRIRVSDVVAQIEYQEKTPEEVVSSFPSLSVPDVYAALTYYYERPTQIRTEIRDREERLTRTATDEG